MVMKKATDVCPHHNSVFRMCTKCFAEKNAVEDVQHIEDYMPLVAQMGDVRQSLTEEVPQELFEAMKTEPQINIPQ